MCCLRWHSRAEREDSFIGATSRRTPLWGVLNWLRRRHYAHFENYFKWSEKWPEPKAAEFNCTHLSVCVCVFVFVWGGACMCVCVACACVLRVCVWCLCVGTWHLYKAIAAYITWNRKRNRWIKTQFRSEEKKEVLEISFVNKSRLIEAFHCLTRESIAKILKPDLT